MTDGASADCSRTSRHSHAATCTSILRISSPVEARVVKLSDEISMAAGVWREFCHDALLKLHLQGLDPFMCVDLNEHGVDGAITDDVLCINIMK